VASKYWNARLCLTDLDPRLFLLFFGSVLALHVLLFGLRLAIVCVYICHTAKATESDTYDYVFY